MWTFSHSTSESVGKEFELVSDDSKYAATPQSGKRYCLTNLERQIGGGFAMGPRTLAIWQDGQMWVFIYTTRD